MTAPEGSGSGSTTQKTGCRSMGVSEKAVSRCLQYPGEEMTDAWTGSSNKAEK